MPQVQMRCLSEVVPEWIKMGIPTQLTVLVAKALDVVDVPDARLLPGDVEVVVTDTGRFDINVVPLSIVVIANEYPERSKNINERAGMIARGVRQALNQAGYQRITGSVWIPPHPGGYVTF